MVVEAKVVPVWESFARILAVTLYRSEAALAMICLILRSVIVKKERSSMNLFFIMKLNPTLLM